MGRSKKQPIPTGPGACRLCPRWENARTVCMQGWGPLDPEFVVVGEGPGATEDRVGRPFVGPAGKRLHQAFADAGIDHTCVYYLNAVRCFAPTTPTMLMLRKCRMYTITELQQLDYSKCHAVMLLGESALHGVMNDGRLKLREARLRDLNAHTSLVHVPLRCTYHPAATLEGRSPWLYDELVTDLIEAWKPRDIPKPTIHVTSESEIHQHLTSPEVLGFDLEWHSTGTLRVAALSDGVHNIATTTPHTIITYLHGTD